MSEYRNNSMSESKPYDVLMNTKLKSKLLDAYKYQENEPYDMTDMNVFLREVSIAVGLTFNNHLLTRYMYRKAEHARFINNILNPQIKNIDELHRMIMDAEHHRLQYVMSP